MKAVVLAILSVALTAPVKAQWLNYPTPGIPRTADGKPKLTAPTPRTADGKPDLTGVWNRVSPKYGANIAADLKPGDIQPWAQTLVEQAQGRFGQGSYDRALLAAWSWIQHGAAVCEDRADSHSHRHARRGSHVSPDLPRWPSAGVRSAADLDGILGGALGWRHAGGRQFRIQ